MAAMTGEDELDMLPPIARGRRERASREEGDIKLARSPGCPRYNLERPPSRRVEPVVGGALCSIGEDSSNTAPSPTDVIFLCGWEKRGRSQSTEMFHQFHPIAKGRKERSSREEETARMPRPPRKA